MARRTLVPLPLIALLLIVAPGCPRRPPPPPPATAAPVPVAPAAPGEAARPVPGPDEYACDNCGALSPKENGPLRNLGVCSESCKEELDAKRREAFPDCAGCGAKDWESTDLVEVRPGVGEFPLRRCRGCKRTQAW